MSSFHASSEVAPDQALLRDFDFIHPRFEQRSLSVPLARSAPAVLAGRLPGRFGVYEHKMEYEEPDLQPTDAGRHLEQLRASSATFDGESRTARLRPGRSFTLTEAATAASAGGDARFTVTRVEHEGRAPELEDATQGGGLYRNRFACVRAEVPFRPERPVRRLRQVTETATVVGPAGEEIHADPHGRVKVQFHWDLDGKSDAQSSCWIRVSQPWAGPGWGHQFIPRIGMEVVVTFLGGDLDRPLITGTVYNAINAPLFPIPSEVTRSGIKTRSTPGGDGYNEISFDDAKGVEQIRVHAERNLDEAVLVDHTTNVGRDQSLIVTGNQQTVVLGAQSVAATASRTVHVEGPHSVTTKSDRGDVVHGDHSEEVVGNQNRSIGGTRTETVEGDALQTVRGMLGETIEGPAVRHIGTSEEPQSGEVFAYGSYLVAAGETVRIRAETSVVFECGESSIELTPDGIRLRGRDVRTIATELASMQSKGSTGPSLIATDQIEIAAREIHLFGEDSRLSLTKEAELTSGKKTVVMGGGAGLGLAGGATLAGGKVIVSGAVGTLVLDADAKLDGGKVKLNCGGERGGVSEEDRDPKKLDTPRDVVMKKFHVRILDAYRRPLGNRKYVLTVDGKVHSDVTGPAGDIDLEVVESAEAGQLSVWKDESGAGERMQWKVDFETTLPRPSRPAGARVRLANLGYYVGPPVEKIDERLRDAIKRFQRDHRLPEDGELGPETAYVITTVHGH